MARTVYREGTQSSEPPAIYGNIRTCNNERIIKHALGIERYEALHNEAAQALEPDFPEIALLYPALWFNALERPTIVFFDSLAVGSLKEVNTPDVRSWKRKLPDDDGELFRATAKLMKWN